MSQPSEQQPPHERLSYRIADLPRITGIGRSTIYEAIAAGKLRAVKNGRATIVLSDDLKRWLASFEPIPAKVA